MESPMRKVVYVAIAAAAVLTIASLSSRDFRSATASGQIQANDNDIVNVRALESTIDLKALPRQDINYVD
jgi:hypothetical protein